ncbi:serine hydrolase [Lacrimispora aerotolerans]|uniref:serine hydrolase n=1 Tax=Lacrimispora aerotolerans TaxID=36832 RepID=UPI00047E82C1|nr:serine hydrolase [Lacrimispora aerotolerans]
MDVRLTLEKRIEAEIKSYDGVMGIYLDDLRGTVIQIKADETFETASAIKTWILACLFWEAEKGRACLEDQIEYKKEHWVDGSGVLGTLEPGALLRVKDAATFMMIVSDNVATNMMIDYLGLDRINQCIRRLGSMDTVLHNPIHFDQYERLGTSTPRDYASIFVRLVKGELISPEADRQMLEILKKQQYQSMITKDFPPYFMDSDNTDDVLITVASKSGSMDACRNDGGIVFTPYGPYVIVMFHKEFSDAMYYPAHSATMFGARVSRLMLDQYLALEGRFYPALKG